MKEFLGIDVPDDAHGVLQDVHWSGGGMGYFPTYALGNVISLQIWQRVREELPDLDDQLAAGDALPLGDWLRDRLYRHGRKYTPKEMLERVAGTPQIDPEPVPRLPAREGRGAGGRWRPPERRCGGLQWRAPHPAVDLDGRSAAGRGRTRLPRSAALHRRLLRRPLPRHPGRPTAARSRRAVVGRRRDSMPRVDQRRLVVHAAPSDTRCPLGREPASSCTGVLSTRVRRGWPRRAGQPCPGPPASARSPRRARPRTAQARTPRASETAFARTDLSCTLLGRACRGVVARPRRAGSRRTTPRGGQPQRLVVRRSAWMPRAARPGLARAGRGRRRWHRGRAASAATCVQFTAPPLPAASRRRRPASPLPARRRGGCRRRIAAVSRSPAFELGLIERPLGPGGWNETGPRRLLGRAEAVQVRLSQAT